MTDWRDAYPIGTKVEVMVVSGGPAGWQPGVVSYKGATERQVLWVDLGNDYGACFADPDKVRLRYDAPTAEERIGNPPGWFSCRKCRYTFRGEKYATHACPPFPKRECPVCGTGYGFYENCPKDSSHDGSRCVCGAWKSKATPHDSSGCLRPVCPKCNDPKCAGPSERFPDWCGAHLSFPRRDGLYSEALRVLREDYGPRAVVLAESHALFGAELARRAENVATQKLVERLRDALSDALTAYGNKWSVPESIADVWELAEDDATEWLSKRRT